MSQLGSITAEKEKQMALERQRFQEAKAKMLAQQKYKRAARTAGHIVIKYCRGVNCSSASFIRSKYCIYAIR